MSYEIKIEETAFTDVDFSDVSSFTFKEYHFNLKRQPFIKHWFGRGRTNGIDRDDDIVNSDDLLRLILINEECENPEVVDVGELTRNINQKKNSGVLQACRCLFCDKCYRREYFFNKKLEYCESVW